MHVVLDQRRVRYAVVSADEVRRFAPLPRTVYLVRESTELKNPLPLYGAILAATTSNAACYWALDGEVRMEYDPKENF